jgi:hypothetical protein
MTEEKIRPNADKPRPNAGKARPNAGKGRRPEGEAPATTEAEDIKALRRRVADLEGVVANILGEAMASTMAAIDRKELMQKSKQFRQGLKGGEGNADGARKPRIGLRPSKQAAKKAAE